MITQLSRLHLWEYINASLFAAGQFNLTNLGIAAITPILICLFYLYIRDKYEKEPVQLLLTGVLFGVIITFPIIHVENLVTAMMPLGGLMFEAFYLSFIVASLVEEAFKYVLLFALTWRNHNLNERFDGIVYATFISLGFAGLENILYVFNPDLGGMTTALMRAVISVPGHSFFGVIMGYHFAMAKFEPERRRWYMVLGFVMPWLIHGIYDYILLSALEYTMLIFIPFLVYLWITGFKKMKKHLVNSPFKKPYQA